MFAWQVEAVTGPRFGNEVFGFGRIRLDLLAQLIYENGEVLNLVSILGAPNHLKELPVRNNLVLMRDKIL